MTTPWLLFLGGLAWGLLVIIVVGLCVAAADGDELARRLLGPASSDEAFKQGVLVSMDDSRVPAERRRRS